LPHASVSALTTLKLDGWRLVVLTNGLPSVQRAKVRALGVAGLVDSVVYAEEHASGGKPAVTVFVEALRRIGVPARRAICVGDDPVRDIAGARQLGIRTVHLRTAAMMPDPQADAVLSSLDTLPAVARELLEGAESDAA
jgi:putative hydrolase of the HAD superfamily